MQQHKERKKKKERKVKTVANKTYRKIDSETFEEKEVKNETATRNLDRAELQTKVDHWEQDQLDLQRETDKKMAELQSDIDRVLGILATV